MKQILPKYLNKNNFIKKSLSKIKNNKKMQNKNIQSYKEII